MDSVGQVAPRYFTNCLLCPFAQGEAMLCVVETQPGQGILLWNPEGNEVPNETTDNSH